MQKTESNGSRHSLNSAGTPLIQQALPSFNPLLICFACKFNLFLQFAVPELRRTLSGFVSCPHIFIFTACCTPDTRQQLLSVLRYRFKNKQPEPITKNRRPSTVTLNDKDESVSINERRRI